MLFTPLLQGGVSGDVTRTLTCVNTLVKRKTQPQGLQKIDWSNPITNGLVLCTHAGNNFVEMTTNKPSVITGATSTATPKGKALTAASTTFSIETRINKHYGEAVTWIIGAQLNSTGGGGFSKLVDKCNAADPSSGTEQVLTQNGIGLSRGGTGGTQTVATPLSFPAPYNIYAVSVSAFTATDGAWYINGVPKALANSTVGIGTMYTNSANYVLCNRTSDFLRNVDGKMDFAYRWNRVLSPAEVASISANPYQIFKAVTKPIYVAAKSLTRRSVPVLRSNRKRSTQPQYAATLNLSNPLTRHIVGYWTPAVRADLTATNNPQQIVRNIGKGLLFAKASAQRITVPLSKPVVLTNTGASILTICFTTNNTELGGFVGISDGASYFSALLRGDLGVGVTAANWNGSNYGQWSSPTLTNNEVGIYVVTINAANTQGNVYKNGVNVTTIQSYSGALSTSSLTTLSIGSPFSDGGNNLSGGVYLAVAFNKVLSPSEVSNISKNPWQIFDANNQSIYLASTPRPRSFVKVKTKPRTTQPQTTPVLRSRYAAWEWVYTPSAGTRNLGSKGIDGVFTGSAGYGAGTKAGKGYALSTAGSGSVQLGDTTCKFTQTQPVSGLIVFTRPTASTNQGIFQVSDSGSGLYIKVNTSNQIEIDTTFSTFIFGTSANSVIAGGINTLAFCIEPRVADGGTGRISTALNGLIATGTWTAVPNFTARSSFGYGPGGEYQPHQQMLSAATTATISNAELVKLSKNPWSIFKAPNDAIFLEKPPATIVTNGLVIHLDAANPSSYNGTGTTWTDLSGNNNAGTLTSGPTYTSDNSGSIVFDGVDDYVQITGNASNTPASMTLFCFIYPQNTRPEEIIASQNFDSGYRFMTRVYGGNVGTTWGFRPNPGALEHTSSTVLSNNVWYCLAITYTASSVSGYVNGVLDWKVSNPGALAHGGNIRLGDGVGGAQRHFQGKLPVFMMYNRALSPAEIQQNYNVIAPRYATTPTTLTTLFANLFSNIGTIYNGTVSSLYTLLAGLYTNSSTLYSNTISSTKVLLADLYNNAGELYNHSVSIWQNSVINYLSNLRTKVVTATTKAIDAISATRTKVLDASTKALNALSATRTKLFTTGTKSVSVTSASRTKVFTPETKSKTFTTTTRG